MCSVLVSLFECNKNGLPLHQHASFKPHGNVDMLSTQHVYCCYDLRVRRSANVSNQSQQLRAWLTRTNTGNKNFASRGCPAVCRRAATSIEESGWVRYTLHYLPVKNTCTLFNVCILFKLLFAYYSFVHF